MDNDKNVSASSGNAAQNANVSVEKIWESVKNSQAVIEFDLSGKVLDANDNFLKTLGYKRGEVVGQHHSIFCTSELVRSQEYKDLWAKLAAGEFMQGEFHRVKKSGEDIWIQASYCPVVGANGKPERVVKVAVDVTQEKIKLASAESMIDAFGRSQAVIEFDLTGNILSANENFCATLGYEENEIIGQHHSRFCDPDYVKSTSYKAFWQQLAAGEFASGEFKRFAKDGSVVWIQATYNPVFDARGKPIRIVKLASDITEAKQKSSDFEGKLRAIDRAEAVIEFDLEGIILEANENFLVTVGYERDEIVGQHHSMFCDAAYAASPKYRMFWQALSRGEFFNGEFRRIGKDGREIWIQASYNPIFDEEGKPYKVVKFASDVTEVKRRATDFEGKINAIDRSHAVIEFGTDGIIKAANENFCKTTGYTSAEIVGKHHRIFCDDKYVSTDAYRTFWQRLAAGEFIGGVFKRIGKNGREIWIHATYNPIVDSDGNPISVVKFATDVTDTKRITLESDAKIAAIDRSQAVIEFDLQGHVIAANDNFLRTMGYTISEIAGEHHKMFCDPAYVETSDYTEFWYGLSKGKYYSGRYKRINKYGREVWIQATYNPILDDEGEPIKVVKFATDISAHVELEQRVSAQAIDMRKAILNLQSAVSRVVDDSRTADEIAKVTETEAGRGAKAIAQSIATMNKIQESASEIAAIVSLIEDVANQTNMLAFNAAIEAARAGEHGYGFSVVADEVRKLAEQSTQATKEVNRLIKQTVERVTEGSNVSETASSGFERIQEGVSKTTLAIASIHEICEQELKSANAVAQAIVNLIREIERQSEDRTDANRSKAIDSDAGSEDVAA